MSSDKIPEFLDKTGIVKQGTFADETAIAIRLFSKPLNGAFLSFPDLQQALDYYYQLMDTVEHYDEDDRMPAYEARIEFLTRMIQEAESAKGSI